jgi:hypothetical protein
MRPPTVRASDPLGPADTRMMAPLHALSALSRAGPGGSAPDLTVAPTDDEPLTNEGLGVGARDRVRNIQPRDASVSVWCGAHEARRMFDVSAEIQADRRGAECRGKGGPLGDEPNARFGGNVGYVDHLKVGSRRHGGRLDGENSRDSDEAVDVLEHTGGLGGGRDARRRYENTYLDVHGIFQNNIRRDVVLEVFIYIPEHIRRDIDGADVRSGRGSELHPTAREAMVGVSFSALAVLVTLLKHCRSGGGSASDRPQRHRGGGGLDCGLTTAGCCDGLSRSTPWSGGSRKWSRGCGPRFLRRRWRYCGLMLGGKRTRGLLHWGGNGGRGGWRWRRWPRHGDNLSKPSLKRGGPANRLGEGVILEGRVLEDLPYEG